MLGRIRHVHLQLELVVACVLVVSSAALQPNLAHGAIRGFSTGEPEAATLLRPAQEAMVATLVLRSGVTGNATLEDLVFLFLAIIAHFAQVEKFYNRSQQQIAKHRSRRVIPLTSWK